MGLACMIIRRGSEKDCENIVHVRAVKVQEASSSRLMLKFVRVDVEEFDPFHRLQLEPVDNITNFQPS